MLQKVKKSKVSAKGVTVAIVASIYNQKYVDGMLRAAKAELRRSGATLGTVVRVPGAFEIPVAASAVLQQNGRVPDAVICLGLLLQGATVHADHIGSAVTRALTELQVNTLVPMIHQVLLVLNEEQAKERCLSREHNRGTEAAQTAVQMALLMRRLRS